MTVRNETTARKIALDLYAAEAAIDDAIAKVSHLAGRLPQARLEVGASALVGQGAIEKSIATLGALAAAREEIVQTHRQLSIAQRAVGLGAMMFGGFTDKPPMAQAATEVPARIAA